MPVTTQNGQPELSQAVVDLIARIDTLDSTDFQAIMQSLSARAWKEEYRIVSKKTWQAVIALTLNALRGIEQLEEESIRVTRSVTSALRSQSQALQAQERALEGYDEL